MVFTSSRFETCNVGEVNSGKVFFTETYPENDFLAGEILSTTFADTYII